MTPEQIKKLPKWARDEFEALRTRLALRWPTEEKPEPLHLWKEREEGRISRDSLFIGWTCWTWGDGFRVEQGCSNGMSHSPDRTDKTTTQGPGRFFRTKQDAILFARWELCERFARTLAQLDED